MKKKYKLTLTGILLAKFLAKDRQRADAVIAAAYPGHHLSKNPPKGVPKKRKEAVVPEVKSEDT